MLTRTGEGRVLRRIVVTGTNPTTGAPSNATAPGGSVKYTAQGVYSGESTPEDINGAIINWTIDDTSLGTPRSEEHTYELQSLMRISYAVFCVKKKIQTPITKHNTEKRI